MVLWRYISAIIIGKLIYTPIFKARCEQCGKGLYVENGVPWIEGNLKIRVGENVRINANCFASGRVYKDPMVITGDRTELGYKTQIGVAKLVQIGSDCMISGECCIGDNDGHPLNPHRRLHKEPVSEEEVQPVIIEDNVWIGIRSAILKGVTVGRGSVIAANSLVTRSIPPYSVAMGVPTKIVISGLDKIYKFKSSFNGIESEKIETEVG